MWLIEGELLYGATQEIPTILIKYNTLFFIE
jgi:hypothetical protein